MSTKIKYPRTYHLPWSPGLQNDDRVIINLDGLDGQEVIVTEKMDGENTSMYRDDIHARSLDSVNHPSRNWVKQFWGSLKHNIPEGYIVCGENMFAKHSIEYTDLESYFLGFSVWNDKDICLAWDDTVVFFDLLGIKHVPILYRGMFDKKILDELVFREGYVVRVATEFDRFSFSRKAAKYVRKDHVQSSEHWMHQEIIPNKLKQSQ